MVTAPTTRIPAAAAMIKTAGAATTMIMSAAAAAVMITRRLMMMIVMVMVRGAHNIGCRVQIVPIPISGRNVDRGRCLCLSARRFLLFGGRRCWRVHVQSLNANWNCLGFFLTHNFSFVFLIF